MATIRKVNGKRGIVYRAIIRRRGVSLSATHRTRSDAEKWARRKEADIDRDIAGITVNRQGHAYVVTPPGFFFGKDGKPAPSEVIRKPHGRIAFAHAELLGYQMWEGAAHEGERAAQQVLEM